MERYILTAALIGLLGGPALADDAVIARHCARDWGDDRRMFDFCTDQQRQGRRETADYLDAFRAAGADDTADHCLAQWPENYQMQAFCLQQQSIAIREVNRYMDAGVSAALRDECARQWYPAFTMIAFCMRSR